MFSNIHLDITPDMVLRGQGADPNAIAKRKPFLVEIARNAILEGIRLIQPKVFYRSVEIDRISHFTIFLKDGQRIDNQLLARELFNVSSIYFIVCTIGKELEKKISSLFPVDPSFSLALDGYGNAVLEVLAAETWKIIGEIANNNGSESSMPFSPGMDGWSVQEGQESIFSILNPDSNDVTLTSSFQMVPKKSSSMIIGIGKNLKRDHTPCDFCPAKNSCRYRTPKKVIKG